MIEEQKIVSLIIVLITGLVIGLFIGSNLNIDYCSVNHEKIKKMVNGELPFVTDGTTIGELKALYNGYTPTYNSLIEELLRGVMICN